MEKLRKGDHVRTSRSGANCSYVSRDESDTTRSRLCRSLRFRHLWGGKKTKQQIQNLSEASVQEDKVNADIPDMKDEITKDTGYNVDFLSEGETLQKDQEEAKTRDAAFQQVDTKSEPVNDPFGIRQSSIQGKLTPDHNVSNNSVSPTEISSTSAVIVVDDSKCDISWKPPGFQIGVERINSLLNASHVDNVSVESENTSTRSSGNMKELIPSGSTTAEDLAESLAAHCARERQASPALSCVAKELKEWKRKISLPADSAESILGCWITGPSTSLKYTDESFVQSNYRGSTGYVPNVRLSSPVLPEDDGEEPELEPDEELNEDVAATEATADCEPSDPLSDALYVHTFRGDSSSTNCWKSNLVDATTSVQSTLVVLKQPEVSTSITPVVSRLRVAGITHIDECGIPSKREGVRVKWDGGWNSSADKEDSTSKLTPSAGSSMSIASPSGRISSPGLSLGTFDSLSALTFSEEPNLHLPRSTQNHKDTEAVRKLTRLLEELSADEQSWLGDQSIEWIPEDLTKEPWPNDVKLFEPNHARQMLLPDHANCLAVEAFLKMCKLDYTVEQRSNAEFMVTCGKVPFIKCGAHVVAGLESIVSFVGNKGIYLTSDLGTQEKGDMRAYMSLITNILANAELYLTWCDPVTYKEVTKPRYGSVFPWPLGPILCWQKRNAVMKRLNILTWANKSLEEVYSEVDKCFQSLSERLGDKNFFFGEKYNELDALLFGHLVNIMTTPLPHPNDMLSTLVQEYPALVRFCGRIQKTFFVDSKLAHSSSILALPPLKPFTYSNQPIPVLQ